MSVIQNSILEFYKTNPDLVYSVSREVVAVCNRCEQEIPLNHRRLAIIQDFHSRPCCPHCAATGKLEKARFHEIAYPIPHHMIRKTKYVTKPARKLFGIVISPENRFWRLSRNSLVSR